MYRHIIKVLAGFGLVVAHVLALGSSPAVAESAADAYIVTDSNDVGGPAFAPRTGSMTVLENEDDGKVLDVPIGFSFEFFGTHYREVSLGVNGGLLFDRSNLSSGNPMLQNTGKLGAFALWDDWDNRLQDESFVRYGTVGQAPNRVFVVEWVETTHFPAVLNAGDNVTFQLQLHQADDAIEFHYTDATTTDSDYSFGASATIGLAGPEDRFVPYSYNEVAVANGFTIRFEPQFCRGRMATIVGSEGDDQIVGTDERDVVVARGGDDDISTLGGSDIVCGGDGRDHIDTAGGPDIVDGGTGADVIDTGKGVDRVDAGPGSDVVSGGDHDDVLRGNGGFDTLNGEKGHDRLVGRGGDDTLNGGEGNDIAHGGDGDDRLLGGVGADDLSGGIGDDVILGGAGPDRLAGERGADVMRGGPGRDALFGGKGRDNLGGGGGPDRLQGGDGNDKIDGNGGLDVLVGHRGDDNLNGGRGADACDGGAGIDRASRCDTVAGVP